MSNSMALDVCGAGKAAVEALLDHEDALSDASADERECAAAAERIDLDPVRDLHGTLKYIGGAIDDKHCKTHTWERRVAALRTLRHLVRVKAVESSARNRKHAVEWMWEFIKEPMATALNDYRSAVIHEACRAVRTLCEGLPPAMWGAMAAWYLPPLLHNTASSTALIAEVSRRTVKYAILQGGATKEVIHCLLMQPLIQAAHPLQRLAAYQALFLALRMARMRPAETAATEAVRLSIADCRRIEAAVRVGVADAMPEVRRVARLLYWEYAQRHPSRAADVREVLDWQQQDRLDGVEAVYAHIHSPADAASAAEDACGVRRGADAARVCSVSGGGAREACPEGEGGWDHADAAPATRNRSPTPPLPQRNPVTCPLGKVTVYLAALGITVGEQQQQRQPPEDVVNKP